MTDMRRTLLWVVFSMSLVFLWDGWQRHNGRPTLFGPAPATAIAPPAAPGAASAAAVPGAVPAAVAGLQAPGASAPASAPAAAVVPVESFVIETDRVRATFSSHGGTLIDVRLLRHRQEGESQAPMPVLEPGRYYEAQSGLTKVAGAPTHQTPMKLVTPERKLAEGAQQLNLRFESEVLGGLQLIKHYSFERGSHVIKVRHEVRNLSAATLQPQLYLQIQRDGSQMSQGSKWFGTHTFTGPALFNDKLKFKQLKFEDLAGKPWNGDGLAKDGWVAMVQHYFVTAWLRPAEGERAFFARQFDAQRNLYLVGMVMPLPQVAAGASVHADDLLYVGPQEEKVLAELAPGLDYVKDYGWFHILAKPLFWLLDQIYKLVGNWGWSIVLLVLLLKIAFYSLNASAYRSMAKMKKVNPRIMEMRERLKDKPQQMQQEMMKIYKDEKVNPLGSCLPILLQIPFFIALYWVLLSSVEMRHAPWVLWIQDLSAIDPFYVLPVLLTLSSLLQVWLNPTPPDPMQAKLMWIMPIMFSVFFFFFPAGLVLYWLVNNLLSIAQQWMINKQQGVQH